MIIIELLRKCKLSIRISEFLSEASLRPVQRYSSFSSSGLSLHIQQLSAVARHSQAKQGAMISVAVELIGYQDTMVAPTAPVSITISMSAWKGGRIKSKPLPQFQLRPEMTVQCCILIIFWMMEKLTMRIKFC